MSLLDHINIIGTIANCKGNLADVSSNQSNNFSFLLGTHSATNNRVTLVKNLSHIKFLQLLILTDFKQFWSFNNNCLFYLLRWIFYLMFNLLVFLVKKLLFDNFIFFGFSSSQVNLLEIWLDQSAAEGDVFCCFEFISSEHPNFNINIDQISNNFGNIILKFILNHRASHKIKITLNLLIDFLNNFIIIFSSFSLIDPPLKIIPISFWNDLHSITKSPVAQIGLLNQTLLNIL